MLQNQTKNVRCRCPEPVPVPVTGAQSTLFDCLLDCATEMTGCQRWLVAVEQLWNLFATPLLTNLSPFPVPVFPHPLFPRFTSNHTCPDRQKSVLLMCGCWGDGLLSHGPQFDPLAMERSSPWVPPLVGWWTSPSARAQVKVGFNNQWKEGLSELSGGQRCVGGVAKVHPQLYFFFVCSPPFVCCSPRLPAPILTCAGPGPRGTPQPPPLVAVRLLDCLRPH